MHGATIRFIFTSVRFYVVDASTLNLERHYVGYESYVTSSLEKQMTSVNV